MLAILAAGVLQPHLKYSVGIGAAADFQLQWTPDATRSSLQCCFSAKATQNQFIALGFSEASAMMNHSDIVAAYFTAAGAPVVKAMFSYEFPGGGGYPGGTPTLKLEDTKLTAADGHLEACFTRAYDSGHYPIADDGRVIWARGNVSGDDLTYHGKDGHDDTGKSQSHRSDECPPINWLSGVPRSCTDREYCCPDAKKCLKPTSTVCPLGSECGDTQVCCPLTKLCVEVGPDCAPACDTKSYCCPGGKMCVSPTHPGATCDMQPCAAGEDCCPITNMCVVAGDACVPE